MCMHAYDAYIQYTVHTHTHIHTYRQTDRQTDRQTYSQSVRQTDRQTDIHTYRWTKAMNTSRTSSTLNNANWTPTNHSWWPESLRQVAKRKGRVDARN